MPLASRLKFAVIAGVVAFGVCGCSQWPDRSDATLEEAEQARLDQLKEAAPESLRIDATTPVKQRDRPQGADTVVADAAPAEIPLAASLPSRPAADPVAAARSPQPTRPKKAYRANEIPNAADAGL